MSNDILPQPTRNPQGGLPDEAAGPVVAALRVALDVYATVDGPGAEGEAARQFAYDLSSASADARTWIVNDFLRVCPIVDRRIVWRIWAALDPQWAVRRDAA